MPEWLQNLIVPVATGAGGALLTALGVMWRYGHAMVKGMQAMMRGELHRIYRETVQQGRPVDLDQAQETADLYYVYHDVLRGNGLGTELYTQIMDAQDGPPAGRAATS
jgi:hypothetical protein